ncbi:MAG: helix-turn-helix domain-containing protein [Patescibacteria group bacterium]
MNTNLISIGETAKKMDVSMDTLRRWDKAGRFPAIKRSGKRFYRLSDIDKYLAGLALEEADLFLLAKKWAASVSPSEPDSLFHCQNSAVFQSRLIKLEKNLGAVPGLENTFPLIVALTGEIGNNSFDHNLGSWPDITGIFFGYDTKRREIALADRGQGILKTLKRVRKELASDADALQVAFTEVLSGRAPEARGNGLKFVKNIVTQNDISLVFQTGQAELHLKKGDAFLNIQPADGSLQGCMALIKF